MRLPKYLMCFGFVTGCAAMSSGLAQQSVLDRFNSKLAEYERLCASGRANDADTGCQLLKLTPRNFKGPGMVTVDGQPLPIPQEWVATKEGQFAHSIKLPQPLGADSGYREGMTPLQYFEHLCAREAGEFIYRTVEGVEGLMQLRRRTFAGDDLMSHLHAIEDPYGHTVGIREFGIYVDSLRYRFFETTPRDETVLDHARKFTPPSADSSALFQRVERFSQYDWAKDASPKRETNVPRVSRYGYIWRGVRRLHDRDKGIASGELIILDLRTREVLGVRRGYTYAGRAREPSTSGVLWDAGVQCPVYKLPGRPGLNKDFDFEYWFIRKVLRPVNLTKPEPYLDVKGN